MNRFLSVGTCWSYFCVLMLSTVFCHGEIIKPEKVTASSELTKFKGHLASFAADGKTGESVQNKKYDEYWCTDFANNAKSPHWLEFDFGAPKKFNNIQLYMFENCSMLFNNFKLEYWDGKNWNTIVEKKNYISEYIDFLAGKNLKNKYTWTPPEIQPTFKFETVTGTKVRLMITDMPNNGPARLREMIVSLTDDSERKEKKPPVIPFKEYPGIYRFDFGPAGKAPKPGFIRISANTVYTDKNGYGWTSNDRIIDCDRNTPSDFRRDFIVSENDDATSTFKVNVPEGRYYLYAMSGDGLLPSPGCKLNANGRAFEILPNDKGDFCPETFACDVKGDALNISIVGAGLLNGLIIAPVNQWRELNEISSDISTDPSYTAPSTKFSKEEQPTNKEKNTITDNIKQEGYVCYVNSPQQRIFTDTVPTPEQIKDELEVAATPGEFESASFSVYGSKHISDLDIKLGELKSDSGDVIASENITLNVVRCWPQRSGHKGGAKTWSFMPELLEPFSFQDVPAESSKQFWLTFHIPATTKSGFYNGTIRLKAANLPEKKLNIKLRIYPFKLKNKENDFFAIYYGGRNGRGTDFCTNPVNKKTDMMYLRDMKKHGMNSIILFFSSTWLSFPDIAEKLMYCNKILNEAGFPKHPIPLHHEEITPKLAEQIRDLVKKENLREVLFYPVDEPFNKRLDRAIKMYRSLKTIPGIRTYSTVTQNDVDALGNDLDVRTYAITKNANFESGRINEECQKTGKTFWWYSNAAREYPDVVRFKSGYFYWKTGSSGQAYFAYANYLNDAFNDLDADSSDHCVVYFKGGKIFSTIQWESIREGIDDYRYIYTLEQAIKENKNKKPEECAKAEKLLDEIKADTIVDLNEYKKYFGEERAVHSKSFWSPEKCEQYRKMIAEKIMNITKDGTYEK